MMGVYIPDMELPKACRYCTWGIAGVDYAVCERTKDIIEFPIAEVKRPDWCPLVELDNSSAELYSEFDELISRRAAIDALDMFYNEYTTEKEEDLIESAKRVIGLLNSADVRETVHGEWLDDRSCESVFECNICGLAWQLNDGTPEENNMNFCPKCGADMRGKR